MNLLHLFMFIKNVNLLHLFKNLNMLKLEDIIKMSNILFTHNTVNNNTPVILDPGFT